MQIFYFQAKFQIHLEFLILLFLLLGFDFLLSFNVLSVIDESSSRCINSTLGSFLTFSLTFLGIDKSNISKSFLLTISSLSIVGF